MAWRRLAYVNAAERIGDLAVPPGNRLEKPGGDRGGQYSIRVNDQYRICFRRVRTGPEDVELVDYH
jgi:proteic killer suppression protein